MPVFINPIIYQIVRIMLRTKQILQLLAGGMSQNKICTEAHCSKRTVSAINAIAVESGKGYTDLLYLPDSEFKDLFRLEKEPPVDDCRKAELDELMPEIVKRLQGRHATVTYVYYDYYSAVSENPYSFTQFKKWLREYRAKADVSYHNSYEPGKEWQIDFAGDALYLTNPRTREKQKLVVLVCVMPYSNLPFIMALPSATTEWFYHGLNKGLEYLGAVPAVAKSDNMKQWVSKSDRYSPTFTEANLEWCRHYGIEPTACRVRSPRDKGPVEGMVLQLYRYVYARIENEEFHILDQLNNRLWELLDEYCERPYKGSTRRDIFEQYEKPCMAPLPAEMFRLRMRKEVKLSATYHVCIGKERHLYSVPFKYVGRKLLVMWDAEWVEVYCGGEHVCVHPRNLVPYGNSTKKEHMPEKHQAYEECKEVNAAKLLEWGARRGPSVREAIRNMLEKTTFPQFAYGRCNGLLALGKKYGNTRLDNACRLMLAHTGNVNYKAVETMLKNRMDLLDTTESGKSGIPYNDQVRGASAFTGINKDGKEESHGR